MLQAVLRGKHTVTGLWTYCGTNPPGRGCNGKDGGEFKVTDKCNNFDNPSNANHSLTRTVEAGHSGEFRSL